MAVGFNGSGDIAYRSANLPSNQTFTISGWVKARSTPGDYAYFFGLENAGSDASGYAQVGYIPGTGWCAAGDGGAAGAFSPQPSINTWYYVFIRSTTTANQITAGYVSANGATFTKANGLTSSWSSVLLGICNDSWDEILDGVAAYVRVWGAELSDAELLLERDSANAVRSTNLIGDWPLANNTDNGDDSGNGYNLTFEGTLTTESDPPRSQTVTASAGVASDEAFGSATVSTAAEAQSITPSGISSAEAFGSITVLPGAATVLPFGIASAEAFGGAVVGSLVTIIPSGIASAEAIGGAVVGSLVTIIPGGIVSPEVFGGATLTPGEVAIEPTGIASAEVIGDAVVGAGALIVTVTGIAGAESFGNSTVTPGAVLVGPSAIAGAEAFGDTTVTPGAVFITAQAIDSVEVFGDAGVTLGAATILPFGIASAEAFGGAMINGGLIVVIIIAMGVTVSDAVALSAQAADTVVLAVEASDMVALTVQINDKGV